MDLILGRFSYCWIRQPRGSRPGPSWSRTSGNLVGRLYLHTALKEYGVPHLTYHLGTLHLLIHYSAFPKYVLRQCSSLVETMSGSQSEREVYIEGRPESSSNAPASLAGSPYRNGGRRLALRHRGDGRGRGQGSSKRTVLLGQEQEPNRIWNIFDQGHLRP